MKNLSTIFILIFFIATISFAKDYKKDFNHTFKVKEGVTIILENGDGDVQINTWDKNEIVVEVTYHASSKYAGDRDKHDFDVEFRRPNAEGGMQQLVQPGDGSRLQYDGSKESQVINAYKILKNKLKRNPTRIEIVNAGFDATTVDKWTQKNILE